MTHRKTSNIFKHFVKNLMSFPFISDDIQVGCKELRSKRYISDGFCTSVKPITELVCTGHCLPIRNLPWYAEFIKVWARTKVLEWRCVEDDIRRKRVVLQCENGETRSYRIKVVKSCKCKRYLKPQNQSMLRLNKSKSNRKRRRKTRRQNESPDYLSRKRRSGGGGRGGDLWPKTKKTDHVVWEYRKNNNKSNKIKQIGPNIWVGIVNKY